MPVLKTFAPSDSNNLGADLYAAPLAQSIAILMPFNEKVFGKFFFKILIYSSVAFSSLLTLPRLLGLIRFFSILESIIFSILFSILSDNFKPSGPNNFIPLSV